jgi:hypothetical protein
MPEERTVNKVFKNIPVGKRSVGKPRKGRLDDVENDLKKMGVRGWRKIDRDRDAWKLILMEARVLHGPYSQWRRNVTADMCQSLSSINIFGRIHKSKVY